MGDSLYPQPMYAPRTHPLDSWIRNALVATYLLLPVSILIFFGLVMSTVFIAEFTVENKTDQTILVTPVGTVGGQGDRYPLPICKWMFPPFRSFQRGGFIIPPGECIDIYYDMDDINFSEIVVQDHDGKLGQLVVNPDPTNNQYHSPAQTHFLIDDLDALATVTEPVQNAWRNAQITTYAPCIVPGLIFGPWIALVLLSWLAHALRTHKSSRRDNCRFRHC